MTEQSLLLRCSAAGRYFIVGTDFPCARVFDTATSSLASVVELPLRSRAASLAALSLTSVAIGLETDDEGPAAPPAVGQKSHQQQKERLTDSAIGHCYAAVGLSNGSLLLQDVRRDMLLAHVAVSETQQAIISVQICGGMVFCLAANNILYAVQLHQAVQGPCHRLRVQPDASAIAVVRVPSSTTAADIPFHVFRVMVAGPVNALYEVKSWKTTRSSSPATTAAAATPVSPPQPRQLLSFASQGTSAEQAWISDTPLPAASLPAVTVSAQEGVVRVWDVSYNDGTATTTVARCRRTLLCGQRLLYASVLPADVAAGRPSCLVAATTFTGSVLLWDLGAVLAPDVAEPLPLRPSVVLVSAVGAGRLLFAAAAPSYRTLDTNATAPALTAVNLQLLRGRFALPLFETVNVGDAVAARAAADGGVKRSKAEKRNSAAQRRAALASLAMGIAGESPVTIVELPLGASLQAMLTDRQDIDYLMQHTSDASATAFMAADSVWTSHQHQVAAKALQGLTEGFKAPRLYHAKSIQDIPVKQMTLEERLRQFTREEQKAMVMKQKTKQQQQAGPNDDEDEDEGDYLGSGGGSAIGHHAIGLATIPLYQALHASDTTAVIDLLNMTARSTDSMRATILSLQLPYCLQLLHVIADRLGLCSRTVEKSASAPKANGTKKDDVEEATGSGGVDGAVGEAPPAKEVSSGPPPRAATTVATEEEEDEFSKATLRGGMPSVSIHSSLLVWIEAILHYRGMEMLALQRSLSTADAAKDDGSTLSPKDYLAPILHYYENLCGQYDKLAVLYGRLSAFKAVRPSESSDFLNIGRPSLGSNMELVRPASRKVGLEIASKSHVVGHDVLFPRLFVESRSRHGNKVVRVRSKLAREKQRHAANHSDAALHARARAAAEKDVAAAAGAKSLLDDDDDGVVDQLMMEQMRENDGALDLEALEAMQLDDDDDETEEEEEEDADGRSVKRRRGDGSQHAKGGAVSTMIADGRDDDDDDDDQLDSSEVEFDSASDDDVHSTVLDLSGEENGDEEDSDDSDDTDEDEDSQPGEDSTDDDDDDDDGMGEDMQALLAQQGDGADDQERRQSKRVRTD